MKRYLLFGWNTYYPDGGWNDFIKDFDTCEELHEYRCNTNEFDTYSVVDRDTKEIIEEI